MQLCFATNNAYKLKELTQLVGADIQIQSLQDIGCRTDIPETGKTLSANSLEKAAYIKKQFGINCFADDTGLEVAALLGEPGIYSARYAGEPADSPNNITLLLKNLEGVSNRKARFRTVITLLIGTNEPVFFEGVVEGEIAEKAIGTTGFGYDPVFCPKGFSRTFAQMTAEEKNSISHRYKAVQKLVKFLKNIT